MKKSTLFLSGLLAAGAFGLMACEPQQEPIHIGATMSESGAYATQGVPAANGYRLCQQHINDEGGLLGRDIEFIIRDDESDTDRAVELYEELITEENVDAIMGPYGSTLTDAVAPVTEEHRMVHISPLAATTAIWERGYEYLFMVLPPAELFLAGLIEMADERGLERIAILQEDAIFPRAAGTGAVELAEEKGMQVTLYHTYEEGRQDFSGLLQEMDEAGTQVLGMAASTLSDFAVVTRQMRDNGVHVPMFGTSGSVDEFQEELGETAEYVYGLSAWEPALPYEGVDTFVSDFREQFGRDPSFHAAGAYGSCQLFAEAAREAGSLDQDELRRVLLDLEITTLFGDFAVDERGYQVANDGLFIQWQDGRREIVWPAEFATSEARFPMPDWDERN